MANFTNTRIQRLYVQPEATWGIIPNTAGVASLAGSNCCRMSSLAINQTQQEIVRSDKTGSLGFTMGVLGRRQATWSTKMSLAPNGAAGVKPDMDPFWRRSWGSWGSSTRAFPWSTDSTTIARPTRSGTSTPRPRSRSVAPWARFAAKRSSTSESMSPWWSSAARHSPFWTRTFTPPRTRSAKEV